MKASVILLPALVALTGVSSNCSSDDYAVFKDNHSITRRVNIRAIRRSFVSLEEYGIVAYGAARLELPTTLALATASAKAATLAAGRAADALAGSIEGYSEPRGRVVIDLPGGREVFSCVADGSVEVLWFYPLPSSASVGR